MKTSFIVSFTSVGVFLTPSIQNNPYLPNHSTARTAYAILAHPLIYISNWYYLSHVKVLQIIL